MFIRKLHWTLAAAAALLGLAHIALTAPLYKALSLPALWFAGSGLAIAAVALVNVLALQAKGGISLALVLLANLVAAAFFALVWPLMPAPQVAVGLALFAGLAACTLNLRLRPTAQSA